MLDALSGIKHVCLETTHKGASNRATVLYVLFHHAVFHHVYHAAKLLTHLNSCLLAGRACKNNKFCISFTVCTKKVGFLYLIPLSFEIGCDSLVCFKIK